MTFNHGFNRTLTRSVATSLLCSLLCSISIADDWPQWMGTQRDGVWREHGVIDAIPASGLPVKWRVPVSLGYSGPAVANGKVYVLDYVASDGDVKNDPGGARQRWMATTSFHWVRKADSPA